MARRAEDSSTIPFSWVKAAIRDCQAMIWCEMVNTRRHRATGQIPADRLDIERTTLHVLPIEPLALALGEERV